MVVDYNTPVMATTLTHTHMHAHQCCGHNRGITINYHCNYLGIKAVRLPLPLRISTEVIDYHYNYISTITITNYRFIVGCLDGSYPTLLRFYICGDLNHVTGMSFFHFY